jgi:type II secretory pathway predicted ATPase ExeA
MHQTYWGLERPPFRPSDQSDFLFASPSHREALARLQFLIDERRPLGILSGFRGSGKSLVLKQFASEVCGARHAICLANPLGMETHDFLWSLAASLQTNPRVDQNDFSLWRRISDRVRENQYQGIRTVILVDDADEASHEVLIQVLRLLKTHGGGVSVILAVEPSRATRLGSDLLQMSQLHIQLEPWTEGEVRKYVRSSLVSAGGMPDIFDDSAIARLCELAGGIPRWVRELAELALLAGAAQHQQHIDYETIECAYQELSAAYRQSSVASMAG